MVENHDPTDTSHWPEEFLSESATDEQETWSLVLVEKGLESADLAPLASHLRKQFSLSPKISEMIADAIENRGNTRCQIYGKKNTGRPVGRARSGTNKHDVLTHTQKVDIGMAAKMALCGVQRPHKQVVIGSLCKQFQISETTIKNAQKYVEKWLVSLSKSIPFEMGT